ncbi:hemerythrin domain-containing protein [Mycobacterium sp. M1]|uniref:Hemerythrin domain-containing protein n=1 Tax=Mycolicibacter acidiphilus TaxID=2835306 RepID=A0ABS5RLS7_9MYCO|nr:hemerythrin domain-containing protein [Mycolicibacter acidiphilus]
MPDDGLAVALEREHIAVDAGPAAFLRGLDGGVSDGVALEATLEALQRHIYLEERILFPLIRHGGMVMPLTVMMSEHGEIWRTMDALTESVLNGSDTERIRSLGEQLLRQLHEHNGKEESVVYPAADTTLTSEQSAELADFLATGLAPDGWYCQEA